MQYFVIIPKHLLIQKPPNMDRESPHYITFLDLSLHHTRAYFLYSCFKKRVLINNSISIPFQDGNYFAITSSGNFRIRISTASSTISSRT